jgi:hypothetical protein
MGYACCVLRIPQLGRSGSWREKHSAFMCPKNQRRFEPKFWSKITGNSFL